MNNAPAPAIGALSGGPALPAPGPSAGAQLLQAIGNAPQILQAAALQRAQGQDQLNDLATKRLQQLAAAGISNQSLATNPMYQRQVEQIYKQLGVPVPKTPEGAIDVHALMPKRSWEEVPDDLKLKGLGLPQGPGRASLFSDVADVPQQYLDAPMQTALSPAAQEGAQRLVATKATDLAMGKISPKQFAGIVKANQNALGDGAQYYLSDAFLEDTLSQAGAANIAKLQALGLHLKNADALKSQWLNQQKNEFYAGLGEKQRVDTSLIQSRAAMDQYRSQQLVQAQQRIDQGNSRLQIMLQNSNTMVTRAQIAKFSAMMNPVLRDYEATQRLYTQTNSQIQNALNAGVAPDQSLLDTQGALKQSLDNMSGTIDQARAVLQTAPTTAAGMVTGQPVHAVKQHLDVNNLPPEAQYSPSRKQYRVPNGSGGFAIYDAQGNQIQ